MIRTAVACLCALAALWGAATAARAQALPLARFTERPTLSEASLSPSGKRLVWVSTTDGASEIHIRELDSGAVTTIGAGAAREGFGGVYVDWIRWKSEDRLLVGQTLIELRRARNAEDGDVRGYKFGQSIVSVSLTGGPMVTLKSPRGQDAPSEGLLDMLEDDPDHVLVTYRQSGLNVARVNVVTGEATKVVDGHARVIDYLTDTRGAVVGRIAYRGAGRVVLMEARTADERWEEVYRLRRDEIRALPDYEFMGPTTVPGKVYVSVRPEVTEGLGNTSVIRVFDFPTRAMQDVVWSHPQYDVAGAVFDAETQELVAGCYWADIYRCDFTDRADNAVMNGIRRFLGDGYSATVVSQSRDGSRWLILATSAANPGAYYLFDGAAKRMEFVGARHPQLFEEQLGQTRRIDYAAADGQALSGYLTRPPGVAPESKPPLIVMPHGGPEMRDQLTYDPWVQFLVSRGYQVFQPNFRGSSGFGRAFAEAGYRQWGRRMQTDVTDGVRRLIADDQADPDRVCLMGASYGGYASLQGAAAEPDLYRCAVSIAGVSDLVSMLNWERDEAGADSDRYEYWVKSIGDPRADRAELRAVSPIHQVAAWRPPVLLIHGVDDDIVPVSQSRDMERALKRAGKEVALVELDSAGHDGWTPAQNTRVLSEVEAFLARHLPLNQPPAQTGQAGSAATDAVRAAPASPS